MMPENEEDQPSEEVAAPILFKFLLTVAPFVLMYVLFLLIRWVSQ